MSVLIAVASIYIFILIGFIAKKVFDERIDDKSFVLISLYFLQPIFIFWGLTRSPIDFNLIYTPFLYFIIVTLVLMILIVLAPLLFSQSKERSIFIASSLIGNTGNLGIPLGIALFGESSVPYTSIINITNIFFIYTVGIYFYAKSHYSIQDSFKEIVKMPILWSAVVALSFNYSGVGIHSQIELILQMAAYATIVLQLIIFGIYLAKTPIKSQNFRLTFSVSFVKLIFLPLVAIGVLSFTAFPAQLAAILVLSLIVPLAVNNVNMAALYNCKPYDVTAAVLVSTLLFIVLSYFDLMVIQAIFGV
ncbi:MAG: AEC family transporter [Campylobacterota bacterium]|nr:AEC family transporter [Campylobacterota bacterium]